MDTLATADALAAPVGAIGSWFYFAPPTRARAERLGLNVFELYAIGRGGVIGNPTTDEVEAAFYFFKPGLIAGLYDSACATISPDAGVAEHLESADEFALATFGEVPVDALNDVVSIVTTLAAHLPDGRWPIVDGYRRQGLTGNPHVDAYRCMIWLREVRGGAHIDAIIDAALTPVEACYLDSEPRSFALHGFTDDDIPPVDEAMRERRGEAERDTSERVAGLLSELSGEQRSSLVTTADVMRQALKAPVPVTSG